MLVLNAKILTALFYIPAFLIHAILLKCSALCTILIPSPTTSFLHPNPRPFPFLGPVVLYRNFCLSPYRTILPPALLAYLMLLLRLGGLRGPVPVTGVVSEFIG